jgi:hypothetical protein
VSCQARAGLLVLRGCGSPAIGACASCGRGLCAMHMLGGGMCPDCSATQGANQDNEYTREAANRGAYYSEYGEPAEYGDEGFFNSGDSSGAVAGFAAMGRPMRLEEDEPYDAFDT